MSEVYATLEEATAALASTAERAAILIRTESARARDEAGRTRREIDDLRNEVRLAKTEFEAVRSNLLKQDNDKDRIRRSAGWAWSAVALMAICMIAAVGWTATQLTRGHLIVSSMNSDLTDLKQSLQNRETELAALRTQLEGARVAQARAELETQLLNQTMKASLNATLPVSLPMEEPILDPFTPTLPISLPTQPPTPDAVTTTRDQPAADDDDIP